MKALFTEFHFWSCRLITNLWTVGISPCQGHMSGRIWISPHFAKPIFLRLAIPSGKGNLAIPILLFRIGKEVEEQRKSMQKFRHSPWHIADTQQWPATLMARLQTAVWGHEVTLEGLQCLLKSPHGCIPLCPMRNLPWVSELNFLWHFPFFSYNGKWSIKSCARPTAFIMDLWRDVGI